MIAKREIYSIAFNRSITPDGGVKVFGYTIGVISQNGMRIPEKIVEDCDYVVVTFTDKSRHRIPILSGGVEFFDREIETKSKKKEEK